MAEEVNTNANVETNTPAEPEVKSTDKGKAESTPETETPKVEDLLAEMAQMKADMARNKNALDKALREKGEITKKLREKQTAEEQEAEAKAEAEAARAEREAEKDKIIAQYEARAMFAEMGIQGKDLEDAVNAKVEGDEKTVYSIIVKYFENKFETALKTEKSEWLGNRPQVNVGVGSNTTLTKEQFNQMSYKDRVELYNTDIETFKRLSE